MSDQRTRWNRTTAVRMIRLAAMVIVLALVAVAGFVILRGLGPPSEQELREQARLVGKRELLIGVIDDRPGVSLLDPRTGQYSGFDIEVAYLVSAELGFRRSEVRFYVMETEDRSRMQARTPDGRFVRVDLVVATFSITPQREALPLVSFSAPYLETEQSVVTRADHPAVDTLEDLRGEQVCTIATATSESPARNAGLTLIARNKISQCMAGLRGGEFDAVTTDAAIMAGFVADEPQRLRHHDIGLDVQETWGINTGGNEALRDLVDLALYRSRNDPRDQRWEEAFDRYLRPEQPANLPQQVAVDQQPDVPEVPVRQWPWERVG